jgi:multicomponent Na+:H+ antiporter subunit D
MAQVSIKKMLAYSTISQLSYIVIGACVPGVTSTVGSVAHLIHQGVMKITLFFCAGAFEREVHVKKLSEMKGLSKRMPLTMVAFTVAGVGMIGLPPTAGFVSKWYLGIGSVEGDRLWVGVVLLLSTLLNAAYFLPPVFSGWFEQPEKEFEAPKTDLETEGWMLYPLLSTALLTVLIGLFADAPVSPLELARLIGREMYK